MKYGYIDKNGEISHIGNCPTSIKNVSGFINSSDEFKASHGWYPVVEDDPTLKEYESKELIGYAKVNNNIIGTPVIKSMTLEEYKVWKYNQIQYSASEQVNQKYTPDQKSSLNAGFYPTEIEAIIRADIKKYFDAVYEKKIIIESATTMEEVELISNEVVV